MTRCVQSLDVFKHSGRARPVPPSHFPHYDSVPHCVEVGAIPADSIAGAKLPAAKKADNPLGHNVSPPVTLKLVVLRTRLREP